MENTATSTDFKTTTLTRTVKAPRQLVFDCFLKPDHLTKWHHADGGWYTPFANIDARPGGELAIGFSSADNSMQFTLGGTFEKIVEPSFISYRIADGRPVSITLADAPNGGTTITWEFGLENVNSEEMQRHGWGQMLKNLDLYLLRSRQGIKQDESVVLERVFNAPRQLVWDAWTKPEMMKKWWGPRAFSCPVAEIDLKTGGKWTFVMRPEEGKDIWCTGRYIYVDPINQLVFTDSFADEKSNVVSGAVYGMPDVTVLEMLVTVDLQDVGDKTRMIIHHEGLPISQQANATAGWGESLDKLEESLH
jgi:uncharacterized protein YndB with AHSA1/START domain